MSNDTDEVETWLEGRELLGRAVGGMPVSPGGSTEAVFARAARVRRRRWGAVTVVAAAGVAAGVVAGPGWLTYDEAGPNVGTARPVGGATQDAARFAKLLPGGVGEIREVDLPPGDLFWRPQFVQAGPSGPYRGDYAVNRDGGVGYLRVDGVFSGVRSAGWKNPCTWRPDAAKSWSTRESVVLYSAERSCTFERLPNGNVLEFRESWDPVNFVVGTDGLQKWGRFLSATLYLKSGGYLQVDSARGFTGSESLGKPLGSVPLDKDQLLELALAPELLPKDKR
ncbi:hypothetical protein OG241_38040 [Streptomyces sp. NBC_01390]|uniref:hypothetical protein n=1 Tax=Streptomyces sp. NBC_01390 TaxID=2903850 RepID=UPI0032531AF3